MFRIAWWSATRSTSLRQREPLPERLGPANVLVSGWQVSGLYIAQSGTPIAVGTPTNLTGAFNDVTDVYGSYSSNSRPDNNGKSAKLDGLPRAASIDGSTRVSSARRRPIPLAPRPELCPTHAGMGRTTSIWAYSRTTDSGVMDAITCSFEASSSMSRIMFGSGSRACSLATRRSALSVARQTNPGRFNSRSNSYSDLQRCRIPCEGTEDPACDQQNNQYGCVRRFRYGCVGNDR